MVKNGGLHFNVDTVFALGSPMATNLTASEKKPALRILDYINAVGQWINLYNPNDVVGVRLGKSSIIQSRS